MGINSIDGIIKTIKKLECHPELENVLNTLKEDSAADDNEDGDIFVLSSTTLGHFDIEDDLLSAVEEVELSASYYIYFETGEINKASERKLKMADLKVTKLDDTYPPGSHLIHNDKFGIIFST